MKKIILLSFLLLLSACGSAGLDDYKNTSPELKLEQFFEGKLKAYGMVFDRSGKLLRRFEVDLIAHWEGDKGEIKEWFVFDDGEKMTRIWQLVRETNNSYTGTASDILGTARGRTQGSALFWQYEMNIEVDGSTYQISLDDWMYLMDDKRLFNKTDMTKFGVKVGEIILYIEKLDPK
ncbi:conserved hypothetical protein [Shewanella denitrificans OS217]|jgi:hypothetical protein|uniref:Lipoprotein n=1 Tax=Shewanella denitrificans (strain OS217 / ATCC BAA-1090 / DSM 15013) TaxID=318161 RepID=Q12IT5_SHEDO|nr:DUF3833 domain-containing protein [Shewanella denitrificans]ABE56641.1 conserved hypothetical protein [Shewanella denitrificans OS217]